MNLDETLDSLIKGWQDFYPKAYSTQQDVIDDFVGDLKYLKEVLKRNNV